MPHPVLTPVRMRRVPFKGLEAPPLLVNVAFWLILLSLAIGLCLLIARVVGFDWATYVTQSHLKELREGRPQIPEKYLLAGLIFSWVAPIVVFALWVALATWLRRGFHWARIVLTVVAGLNLLTLPFGHPTLATFLLLPLDLAPAVLVWLPQSNRYFAAVSRARAHHKAPQLK